MTVHIALLRGVNVGGNHRLPMKAWRDQLHGLGFADVRTYIQSGNAVFRVDDLGRDIAASVTTAIDEGFGFRPACVVLTVDELEAIWQACPFKPQGEGAHKRVHIFFLNGPVTLYEPVGLGELATQDEQFKMGERAFYLYTPQGFGVSKLVDKLGRYLKGDMTARNLRTVETLVGMARQTAG